MSPGSVAALILAALGLAINVALIVWRGGRLNETLKTVVKSQNDAAAESKRQHEETRREISSLREARVASDATAEHLRADVNALRDAVTKLAARVDENDRAQNTARHAQTESLTTTMATLVTAAVSRELAERGARGNGSPRR